MPRTRPKPITIDNPQLEAFLEMMAAERGASAHTLAAYTQDLLALDVFLQSKRRTYLNAGVKDLQQYIASLHKAGLGARTSARRISSTRQLFGFLYQENLRSDDPSHGLDRPRLPKKLPKYLTEEEVDVLLEAARDNGA
ncbi:MAG: site-specific integrase, partial [Rhodospirillaceae bacterium]|nr:site-specific integrase [Rhodospirillaceae bacterium]